METSRQGTDDLTRTVASGGQNSVADAASAATPSLGTERYLVIEELGRGGMGVVVRAYDPRLQREVALKTMHAGDRSDEARARMLREGQAMAKLSHPNVVAVYDVVTVEAGVVIAMEYVRGTTLKSWLSQPRPWREVVTAFVAAGRGLAAAHAAGLLHRDFKPANVLVGDDGRIRVTDFGLARAHAVVPEDATSETTADDALTQTGSVLGTPRYMAPEQLAGASPDPSVDQYAFCVALWEAVTGKAPFAAPEDKLLGPPTWPRDVVFPSALRAALGRGLAAEPSERWPSMEALLDALTAPARQQTTWFTFGASALAFCLAGTAWAALRPNPARCTGAEAQLANIWDSDRRALVRQALLATGVATAEEVWRRLAPRLDAYAHAWVRTHTDACAATSIHGEQPAAVMDLRMACLQRAKVDLRAVTDLLAKADAQVVEKATDMVENPDALAHCSDVPGLEAGVPPPGPAERETVERFRAQLAEVKALRKAGKFPDTLAKMRALAEQARQVSYRPLQLEVASELGWAFDNAEDEIGTEAAFKEVLRLALALRQWPVAVWAAAKLVYNVGWVQQRPAEAMAYAEFAEGLVPIVTGLTAEGTTAEAELRSGIASVLERQRRFAEAEKHLRRGLAIKEADATTDPVSLSFSMENLAANLVLQGRHEEAEPLMRDAVSKREQVLGPDHPDVAGGRYSLARAFYEQGRLEEAVSEQRRSLAAFEKSLGPDHPYVGMAKSAMAFMLIALGRDEEAEIQARDSLRIHHAAFGENAREAASVHNTLGTALMRMGRYEEAVVEVRKALAIEERLLGSNHTSTAELRLRLSVALASTERLGEAEAQARLALSTFEKLGENGVADQAVAHHRLGQTLLRQGRHAEAEAQLRAAVERGRTAAGLPAQTLAELLSDLGAALVARENYEQADAVLREALAVQRSARVPDALAIGFTLRQLGRQLRARGRYDEAEAALREALEQQVASNRADNPDSAPDHGELGEILLARGDLARARRVFEDAWSKWGSDERVPASVRAQLAFGLARGLWPSAGERSRAVELARRALALVGTGRPTRERARVRSWLRKHRVPKHRVP